MLHRSVRHTSVSRLVLYLTPMALLGLSATASAANWTEQEANMATILFGIDFTDTSNGWAAGGDDGVGPVIYHTEDGGNSWVQQVKGMPTATFMDIAMGDEDQGAAAGLGMYYRWAGSAFTSDGGRSWRGSTDRWLASAYQDIDSSGPGHVVMIGLWARAVDYGEGVAVSSDGGVTFDYYDWGQDTSARYGSFINEQTGYVSGGTWPSDDGSRLVVDAGDYAVSRYVRLNTKGPERIETDNYIGVIARTDDGGVTWRQVYQDTGRFYFNAIDFADVDHGWAVAEGDDGSWILGTSDGGRTWDEQHFQPGGSLMALNMVSATEGWAAGADMSVGMRSLFLHTTDGGATWEQVETPLKYYVFSIDMVDADNGWGVGIGGSGLCGVLSYQ